MAEECCRQPRMYLRQEFQDWVQKHQCCAVWINDQVERTLWSPLVRVVDQPVAEGEFQIKASINCSPSVIANPTLGSQQQELGRISFAFRPIVHDRDIGLDQDFRQRDYLPVISEEMLLNRDLLQ